MVNKGVSGVVETGEKFQKIGHRRDHYYLQET